MGYVESTPLFCATTETIADLANNNPKQMRVHPLDNLANSLLDLQDTAVLGVLTPAQEAQLATHFSSLPTSLWNNCLSYVNVYIFILLQQGLPAQRTAARQNLFHHIDRIFCPNDYHDTNRTEVNSIKKTAQGQRRLHSHQKGAWLGCQQPSPSSLHHTLPFAPGQGAP